MKKKLFYGFITLTIISFFSFSALAKDYIKLNFNGEEIFTDVPPQIIKGRTMVPLRWIAQVLNLQVEWDNNKKIVSLHSKKDIWMESVFPADENIREAVGVVSRYFTDLITSNSEDLNEIATARVLDINNPNKILQPFMLTGEHFIPTFDILDVRKKDGSVEVAVRRYIAETNSSTTYADYVDEVYIVIWDKKMDNNGREVKRPLIDGYIQLSSHGRVNKLW
ncbi:hypothetical protein BHF71_01650 [Vulcanibacillus modesticaldus]|uniref:Copper amine oxidase-like N-terminal domain-containing protein n=1 Tax=Vulcanibacillus modesticaldus TaxID=337097 RepID=A0A1D2YUI2_9BACI|nr:copper amine oxidase N-terminal domain-containing protein [Vulcanibacillus modesticaldus]OEF99321.1 hypothetical protein BHF71_01650 [Vulcanibacillus modesticaldus]